MRAVSLLLVAAASSAPVEKAPGQLTSTHELGVGQRAPDVVSAKDGPNRTEAMVQWAKKCMQVPSGLDMQKDCLNLAIAGAGSRTVYGLAQEEKWVRAVHQHSTTLAKDLSGKNPARCFVVSLKEPASRLESWYKESEGRNEVTRGGVTLAQVTLNEYFEKYVIGEGGSTKDLLERAFSINSYFRNYSNVEGPKYTHDDGIPITTAWYNAHEELNWGALSFYKDHGEETQVPGIDVSQVWIDEAKTAPATANAPYFDCEEKQIIIAFLCTETLVPSFWDFANKTKAGVPVTPPSGLQVGVNPSIDESKYPEPKEKFMLSEENRRIWNEAFMYDDMALYRYFCLGRDDEALRQANEDAPSRGTIHRGIDMPTESSSGS